MTTGGHHGCGHHSSGARDAQLKAEAQARMVCSRQLLRSNRSSHGRSSAFPLTCPSIALDCYRTSFARGAAEVIRLPLVVGSSSGGSQFYVHAANRISYHCCVLHYDVSFVPVFPLQPGGQSQERLLGKTRCARSDCQYECPIPVHRLHSQWQIPHVPSRLGVSIKVAIPCDQRQAKCSPSHQEGWRCTCSKNQRTAFRGANTKRYRQMSGLAPEGKDDNVNEYWASERFCDPSYGWRAWNRRSDLFRR